MAGSQRLFFYHFVLITEYKIIFASPPARAFIALRSLHSLSPVLSIDKHGIHTNNNTLKALFPLLLQSYHITMEQAYMNEGTSVDKVRHWIGPCRACCSRFWRFDGFQFYSLHSRHYGISFLKNLSFLHPPRSERPLLLCSLVLHFSLFVIVRAKMHAYHHL